MRANQSVITKNVIIIDKDYLGFERCLLLKENLQASQRFPCNFCSSSICPNLIGHKLLILFAET